ncbi:MAG TPA: hypothetical protein VHP33_13195 [Polyangiaceae bacterium]|nr:hypothetical protein [Polyangiaceae bacterium]
MSSAAVLQPFLRSSSPAPARSFAATRPWPWLGLSALLACSAGGGEPVDKTPSTSAGSGGSAAGQASVAGSGGTSGSGGQPTAGAASGAAGSSGTATGGTATGGSAGAAGSGGTAEKGSCASADILCLTFEELAAGSMPQMEPFQKYNCGGQATSTDLLVEDGKGKNGTKGFTSKKSLNGGCNLLADLGAHEELWVTADVKFSAGVPVGTVHELTPFEITATATDDPGVRPGIRADNSCNSWPGAELNITGGGERTGCTAFKFMTEQWYCLEVQVKNLAASVEGHLFIDSVEPSYHIHQDAVTSVVNTGWTGARMLRLGARSYSSSVEAPLYIDNLSVSTKRVGCINP